MPADQPQNPPLEQALSAQKIADAHEQHRLAAIHREASNKMLDQERRKGAGEAELEAMRGSIREAHQKQLKELVQMQQDRIDRLIIRYQGKDAGLDKEQERQR